MGADHGQADVEEHEIGVLGEQRLKGAGAVGHVRNRQRQAGGQQRFRPVQVEVVSNERDPHRQASPRVFEAICPDNGHSCKMRPAWHCNKKATVSCQWRRLSLFKPGRARVCGRD